MGENPESLPGVWALLKRILDTLLAAAQSRVELFALELQEEKCRMVEAILCTAAVAACGMMTLSLATFTLVVLFWEHGRLAALCVLCVFYLVCTILAWRALQTRLRAPSPFTDSIAEIKRDRECLKLVN